MQHQITRFLGPLGLLLLALAMAAVALLAPPPAPGQAAGARLQAFAASPEAWRLGVASEGNASYTSVIGRFVGANASFRSNRGVTDIYYIFPAPASSRSVSSAAWNIVSRSGIYTGSASLMLEVRSYDGTLQRSISAVPVDLQTAATGSWFDLALAADPASLTIAPGEYLAFHFALDGASSGDLDVRPVFEVVTTTSGSPATATPMATANTTATPTATVTATVLPTQRKVYLPLVLR
jgi:hypothetical protein